MAANHMRARIRRELAGREDPLPDPLRGRRRVFPLQGIQQIDTPVTCAQVFLVQQADALEVARERPGERRGEYGASILLTFASLTVTWL